MTKHYQVLSPDNIPIGHETYTSLKAARAAFIAWRKRYEAQGYYRDNKWQKIPLSDLSDYCSLITV